jgi:hypothetical protein
MTRRAPMLLAAMVVVGLLVGGGAAPVWAAPAPVNPVPTAAHPFQGLRRLTVATIPPVPGMQFSIDGRIFVADARGVASTIVTKPQREAVRADRATHLAVVNPVFESAPGVRARFTGWSGSGQYRNGVVPEEYERATFDIDYLTSFTFATVGGAPIAASSLTSMQLMSSLGDRIQMQPAASRWLQGTRTATGNRGLQSRAVSYRVQSVRTAGVNAVNRGQQQFFPSRQQHVSVQLLYFDVTFSARDALFGSKTGSSIRLQYPDGHEATYALGKRASVTVRQLPRGTYHVTVLGAGPAMTQKVTVSKDQQAGFDTITWIDLALGLAVVLLLAIGLFVLRRLVRKRGAGGHIDVVEAERAERDEELVGAP